MKTKLTRGDVAYNRLIDEGWTFSHSALFHGYRYAGTVSSMQTKCGYEYCRVHYGRCKNVSINGGSRHDGFEISCQVTDVMRRKLPA